MKIHREGYPTIVFVAILLLAARLILRLWFPESGAWTWWIYGPLLLLLVFVLQFFRSPNRKVVQDPSIILSPADGRVVVVEETIEKEFFKGKLLQVSIFMSPANVHQNRYPVSGKVLYKKHHHGKFLVAWNPKSSTLNERTSIAFETHEGRQILMHQVAGFVARRIVCYSKTGMEVTQGKELGFIKFGSRVDLYLPLDVEPLVKIGDMVKGGIHPIARF
ncbi:MAG: phosphatidylserine decarboxylase family protein [Bacteroides sp.]|jgi:phosphatidylserine decarboxylase|nr:phosphatidylserine decarboxylase family protein [Bacteroides sp.]